MSRSIDSLLRPEAQPLGWDFLNDSQRRAFRQLASQIEGAIDDLTHRDELQKELATDRVLTWIRHDALARLSMLEGGRGSGKTTVLLSLLDMCDRDARKLPGVPDDLREPLAKIDRRSIWLDPIDLDMFPRAANLLAAILARIEARIKQRLERDPQRDDAVVQRLLHNLYRKVAVAWGEYEKLDEPQNLDAYATDVKRIEQQRLALRSDFAELLDLLAGGIFHGDRFDDPLFVLPIDDFDLNPTRCFSVLNVLRQVSVPRLYAVLLGNFSLLGAMIHLKFIRDFRHASGEGLDDKWLTINPKQFGQLAEQTAEAWIRKTIPPLQRILIADLKPHEVLLFRPPAPEHVQHPFLFELLAELPMVLRAPDDFTPGHEIQHRPVSELFGRRVTSFLDFCLFPGFRKPAALPKQRPAADAAIDYHALGESLRSRNGDVVREAFARRTNDSAYLAPSRIRSVPRNVADIWLRVQHLLKAESSQASEGQWRRLMRLAKDLCCEEVLQDAALTPEERASLIQALDRCLQRDADLDGVPLTFSCDLEPPHIIRTSDFGRETVPDAQSAQQTYVCRRDIVVRETNGWRLTAGSEPTDARECRRETAAHFMIFHDLVTLANRRLRGIFPDMPFRQFWAETEWNAGPYDSTHLRWPHPLLNSFWEYDIFLQGWNQIIRWVTPHFDRGGERSSKGAASTPQGNEVAESLLFAWIDLSLAVMTWEQPLVAREGEIAVQVPPSQGQWRELGQRLEQSVARTNKLSLYGLRFSRWLTRVALLFMPEVLGAGFASQRRKQGGRMVANTRIASLLAPGGKLEKFWLDNAEFIRRKRTESLATLTAEGMKQVVEIIQKESRRSGKGLQGVIKLTTPTPRQVETFLMNQAAAARAASQGTGK